MGIVLFGMLPEDREAPRDTCSGGICSKCEGYQKAGIILISIRDGEGDRMREARQRARSKHESSSRRNQPFFFLDNPYRTGGWVVVKEGAVERMLQSTPEIWAETQKRRVLFLEQAVWDTFGLPATPETPNTQETKNEKDEKITD